MTTIWKKLEEYGDKTIVYTLDHKMNKLTTLAITKANELVELDGGRELLRSKTRKLPNSFKLHHKELDFDIIYTTPSCKEIAEKAKNKYKCELVMIFN